MEGFDSIGIVSIKQWPLDASSLGSLGPRNVPVMRIGEKGVGMSYRNSQAWKTINHMLWTNFTSLHSQLTDALSCIYASWIKALLRTILCIFEGFICLLPHSVFSVPDDITSSFRFVLVIFTHLL